MTAESLDSFIENARAIVRSNPPRHFTLLELITNSARSAYFGIRDWMIDTEKAVIEAKYNALPFEAIAGRMIGIKPDEKDLFYVAEMKEKLRVLSQIQKQVFENKAATITDLSQYANEGLSNPALSAMLALKGEAPLASAAKCVFEAELSRGDNAYFPSVMVEEARAYLKCLDPKYSANIVKSTKLLNKKNSTNPSHRNMLGEVTIGGVTYTLDETVSQEANRVRYWSRITSDNQKYGEDTHLSDGNGDGQIQNAIDGLFEDLAKHLKGKHAYTAFEDETSGNTRRLHVQVGNVNLTAFPSIYQNTFNSNYYLQLGVIAEASIENYRESFGLASTVLKAIGQPFIKANEKLRR